jgi:hypothetical protein
VRAWGTRAVLALSLVNALCDVGCGPDPCDELVRESCGDQEQCDATPACRSARQLRTRDVAVACESARENSYSYPRCEL